MCASCSFDGEGSNPIGGKLWLSMLNECLDKGLFEQCTQWIQMKVRMVDWFIKVVAPLVCPKKDVVMWRFVVLRKYLSFIDVESEEGLILICSHLLIGTTSGRGA